MFRRLFKSIHEAERKFTHSYGTDISTPAGRRQAFWHYHLSDHGFLRVFWTNLHEIAPGVWRSNQPSAGRLRRYHAMGIRTIVNLRGADRFSFYLFEREAAARTGIEMIDIKIRARSLVPRERFMELFAVFDRIERPFVMHCKSGADRAGLASALWLMDQEGIPVEVAKEQLHWRYAHLRATRTGILDFVLDRYAHDNAARPIAIRDWFRTRYDPRSLTAAWSAARRG